ncbi:hypothetical protein JOF53_006557 [Crossiella equi]|uniref:DUF4230 domain-containing protein n=1 Tax=Crossiella equi TaxID=130796 RepID=A0ABS5APS7_9PSEU|nr:hypothetical protein [Crossiella equi]MBP2477685.1 hypothetical protein [Crossiella equi]
MLTVIFATCVVVTARGQARSRRAEQAAATTAAELLQHVSEFHFDVVAHDADTSFLEPHGVRVTRQGLFENNGYRWKITYRSRVFSAQGESYSLHELHAQIDELRQGGSLPEQGRVLLDRDEALRIAREVVMPKLRLEVADQVGTFPQQAGSV